MKRLLIIFLLCAVFLCGCDSRDEIPTEEVELWVVTELTEKYGMNDQAERMIDDFVEMYPNVTVKLDIMPVGAEERAVYLEKLRTKIMGGAGPDVYLMPTNNSVPDPSSLYGGYMTVEPLFRNVEQVMYNCMFYDISKYYDADEALETDELNACIMDAGVMDGCRYVLPLRYDIGVRLVDVENLEAHGMDVDVLNGTVTDVMAAALELGDKTIAYVSDTSDYFYYFSQLVDYETEKVLLNVDEVAEYFHQYQAVLAMGGSYIPEINQGIDQYFISGKFFAADGYGMVSTRLSNVLSNVAMAKVLGEEIEMYPIYNAEGGINAVVRWYGAVGAGSEYPRLAYEFLCLFLEEEAQYESYLATGQYRQAYSDVAVGWPVRTVGSAAERWEIWMYRIESHWFYQDYPKRQAKLLDAGITITDEDIPAFDWNIDHVIFPLAMENGNSFAWFLNELNDYESDNAPEDVDIEAMAQDFIDGLQLYLYEG